jgi:1-acyl-sn-glycerol-3-phosphate acyltransferase
MTIVQKITYVYLNTLAKIVFRIYFRRIRVEGGGRIPKGVPLIIAPNHPNTMVDPVLMANIMPVWIHFLANYGLFKHPVGKFMMSKVFFSIPVKRPKDVEPGEMVNNLTTIKQCAQVLTSGGSVFMGPEATSYTYRRVRPLKDGIARIGLSAAKRGKFKSGLVILPVGTNYSSPTHFRSEIICHIGQPIPLDGFRQMYKKDKSLASDTIMRQLREQLETLSVHTRDEEEARFLHWCETLAGTDGHFQDFSDRLAFAQKTLPRIRQLQETHPDEFIELWRAGLAYFSKLEQKNTDDKALRQSPPSSVQRILLVVGWPFYLLGCLLNVVWFASPWLFQKMKLYEGYTSMIKILTGLMLVPLYYLSALGITYTVGGAWAVLAFASAALLTGCCLLPFRAMRERLKKYKATLGLDKSAALAERRQFIQKLTVQGLL